MHSRVSEMKVFRASQSACVIADPKTPWAATAIVRASAAFALTILATSTCTSAIAGSSQDRLLESFANPPSMARPRVWWHWMNGNVTSEGVDRDLDWMKRIGVRGLMTTDIALRTPKIVANRLSYMSPAWRQMFRHAVEKADQNGLELGIFSSPGFSETGGPWVEPRHAMKKFVWSMTLL
jgi:hypothetical protein